MYSLDTHQELCLSGLLGLIARKEMTPTFRIVETDPEKGISHVRGGT